MKTFINQPNDDEYITIPAKYAADVIDKFKKEKTVVIHKVTNIISKGVIITTIKFHRV